MSTRHAAATKVRAGRPALTRLLGDVVEEFAAEVWGSRALLCSHTQRGGDDDFSDLFGLAAVDELVSRRGLRTPFVRMAQNGSTLPESAFTTKGGVGAGIGDQVSDDRVLDLFAGGATLVLQALHRTWAPVVDFSQQVAAELGHPVQVNAYVTPEQSQGFSDHYDVHDVFVLQIHGSKRWSIREPVLTDPLRDQPWTDRRAQVEAAAGGPPDLQETFVPGDCLYLPRGFIHSAKALGGVSIHLTLGVHGWTRHHLAETLLDQARRRVQEDPAIRSSLGLGPDRDLTADVGTARQALVAALGAVPDDDVVQALQARSRAAQRPQPLSPLAQLTGATAVGADTVVSLRQHLALSTSAGTEGEVWVRSRAGRFGMPSAHLPVLERLTALTHGRVGDLDDDQDLAVEAVRTLLRHGIALPT